MGLKRGTYVIMNDVDCPEGKLVAVLTKYDDKQGVWHALYLSTATMMADPHGTQPTPLAEFGKDVEWSEDGRYRIIATGEPCTAKYRDGVPRKWQDRSGRVWFTSRKGTREAIRGMAA